MADVVYTTQSTFEDKGGTVLVVACSAYAFLPAVREFLEKKLGLPEGTYNLLAVPGGPQFLTLSEYLPKFAWAGNKWVNFAVDKLGVTRIVLISHQDCVWYADERILPALLQRFGHGGASTEEHQRSDLHHAAAELRGSIPAVVVEAYYLVKTPDGHLAFEREA